MKYNTQDSAIQDILPLVENPSRYLGTEKNSIKKNWDKTPLHMALAFPDLYEIGTSHFGLQILYSILNNREDTLAERFFTPAVDMEQQLRENNAGLVSLESHTQLNQFDIIGFSLLYELNYTNMLNMFDMAGIPFLSKERDASYPILIAGGPCTCNPEPAADFFDAIVIGDGETVIHQLVDAWFEWQKSKEKTKKQLLRAWSKIKGVYIPEFFIPRITKQGYQTLEPVYKDYKTVKRAVEPDLNKTFFPESPLIPFSKPVHDRLRIEVSRGCTRGCRFCQAGMIYRPVRERSPEKIVSLAKKSLKATGYEDLSLLSLSTGDYGCIAPLMESIMAFGASDHIAVSLPSLRAGTLTPKLMELVKKVRKTGFTIAPEAGSQRLRDVINKNISEEDIVKTVKDAFNTGWKVIKLYFMIGLPTETDEDLEAIVELVKKLKTITSDTGKSGKINVSVTTFIPKSHTPFQWAGQISLEESTRKIKWLKEKLKIKGVHFKWQDPKVSRIEGMWARGDRRLSRILIKALEKGCKFDGWSDKFNYDAWEAVFKEEGLDVDLFAKGFTQTDRPVPWQHIDTGIDKKFLLSEWNAAFEKKSTNDCRNGECNDCGVCDFKQIEPIVFNAYDNEIRFKQIELSDEDYKKVVVVYRKMNAARFFGHLELAKIFIRALKRSQINLQYSKGFHPMPKVSFDDPLPMGMESGLEKMFITTSDTLNLENIKEKLNDNLPPGVFVTSCYPYKKEKEEERCSTTSYWVELKNQNIDKGLLQGFKEKDRFPFNRVTKKGKIKERDLKEFIEKIDIVKSDTIHLTVKNKFDIMVRPAEALKIIFNLSPETLKSARVIKNPPAEM